MSPHPQETGHAIFAESKLLWLPTSFSQMSCFWNGNSLDREPHVLVTGLPLFLTLNKYCVASLSWHEMGFADVGNPVVAAGIITFGVKVGEAVGDCIGVKVGEAVGEAVGDSIC